MPAIHRRKHRDSRHPPLLTWRSRSRGSRTNHNATPSSPLGSCAGAKSKRSLPDCVGSHAACLSCADDLSSRCDLRENPATRLLEIMRCGSRPTQWYSRPLSPFGSVPPFFVVATLDSTGRCRGIRRGRVPYGFSMCGFLELCVTFGGRSRCAGGWWSSVRRSF